jgi:hypothetical protein
MQELIGMYYSMSLVFMIYEMFIILKTRFFIGVLDYTTPEPFVPSKEYFFQTVHFIMCFLLLIWCIVGLFTSISGFFFLILGWAGFSSIIGYGYLRTKFSSFIYFLLFFLILYTKYNLI